MDEISSNIVVERSVASEATGLLFQHFISLCHNEGPWKCQMRLHSNWHLKVVKYRASVPGVDDGEEKEWDLADCGAAVLVPDLVYAGIVPNPHIQVHVYIKYNTTEP